MRLPYALLAVSALASGQAPDYFPLQRGNQYVYKGTGTGAGDRVTDVAKPERGPNDANYHLITGFGLDEMLVRITPEGRLMELDPDSKTENLLIDFNAKEGESFTTAIDPCSSTGVVKSRSGVYSGPLGDFKNALIIEYTGSCADAGIVRDIFLSGIGLAQRTESSFSGPRVYDLTYALIGGVTQVAAAHISFGIALDRGFYAAGETVSARLSLRNTSPVPVILDFSSGQEFDIAVVDAEGKNVYQWSADKLFAQALHSLEITGEKNWPAEFRLPANLAPGKYSAQAWLTTAGTPTRKFSASVALEVQ